MLRSSLSSTIHFLVLAESDTYGETIIARISSNCDALGAVVKSPNFVRYALGEETPFLGVMYSQTETVLTWRHDPGNVNRYSNGNANLTPLNLL